MQLAGGWCRAPGAPGRGHRRTAGRPGIRRTRRRLPPAEPRPRSAGAADRRGRADRAGPGGDRHRRLGPGGPQARPAAVSRAWRGAGRSGPCLRDRHQPRCSRAFRSSEAGRGPPRFQAEDRVRDRPGPPQHRGAAGNTRARRHHCGGCQPGPYARTRVAALPGGGRVQPALARGTVARGCAAFRLAQAGCGLPDPAGRRREPPWSGAGRGGCGHGAASHPARYDEVGRVYRESLRGPSRRGPRQAVLPARVRRRRRPDRVAASVGRCRRRRAA